MNWKKFLFNVYTLSFFAALAILIILIFLVLGWLKMYTHHGEEVVIPNVKSLQIEEVKSLFSSQDLQYTVVDSIYVKNKRAGTILETVPPVGTHVKKGRTVYLTINAYTANLLTLPSVVDMSQQSAKSRLTSIGFEWISIKMVAGHYKDLVVAVENNHGQTLNAGDRLPANSAIVLIVASGMVESDITETIEEISENESWY